MQKKKPTELLRTTDLELIDVQRIEHDTTPVTYSLRLSFESSTNAHILACSVEIPEEVAQEYDLTIV